ncbi:hypothetical protein [Maribacter flavus]|uniref:Viral A-type inclusion protein n=1 Tax=Maribacter flavus TaxID=1658664 RepID=A0A5B2TZP4_9FLAO|nr:hypothetical protein [Maribacter flavus]KAA2219538.1 hypothetical protein F0361_08050 [Maribacter flavus]
MKKYFIRILSCFLLFISCKEEKKETSPSQMEQVMAIHDEVMPKMGQLGKLVGQLKPMADSLGTDSPQAKAMRDLQDANKSMMDWMQGFGDRFEPEEIMDGKELSEEKKQWLKEEEEKVKEVKEKINSSIANAEALLGNN